MFERLDKHIPDGEGIKPGNLVENTVLFMLSVGARLIIFNCRDKWNGYAVSDETRSIFRGNKLIVEKNGMKEQKL